MKTELEFLFLTFLLHYDKQNVRPFLTSPIQSCVVVAYKVLRIKKKNSSLVVTQLI